MRKRDEKLAQGLATIRDAFAESARRAQRAGIDALELHMAHGYLLHEFLSPVANARTDAYGGSFDRRIAFPLEVFDAVRAGWPAARPLGVRLSCIDWVDRGWTPPGSMSGGGAWRRCGFADWMLCRRRPRSGRTCGGARERPDADRARALPRDRVPDPHGSSRAARQRRVRRCRPRMMARAFLWDREWVWRGRALGAVAPPQYLRSAPRDAAGVFGVAKSVSADGGDTPCAAVGPGGKSGYNQRFSAMTVRGASTEIRMAEAAAPPQPLERRCLPRRSSACSSARRRACSRC